MSRDIKELITKMSLEEKASLCSGKDFWHLKGIPRLAVPSAMVCDGPHGLRKQEQDGDHLGINDSIEAVCFPAACALASSFDRALMQEMGEALGEECQAEGIFVLLGPAINIKRSPLCGRNFEYFSEDPYVAGELAAAVVNGIQKMDMGACPKHYAANNQEYRRFTVSAEVDERTLREIYLSAFEIVVKKAKPWSIMCSYNRLNGEYVSESKKMLTKILRNEWNFEGFVVSDWGAVNDRVKGLAAGMDLEMPSSNGTTDELIVAAVQNGILDEEILDQAVERILRPVFSFYDNRISASWDKEAHHELAVRIARESAVLLKNEANLLPLNADEDVVFIGEFAEKPRFQGGGSSHINAYKYVSALDAVKGVANVKYSKGFLFDGDGCDHDLFAEAIESAKNANIAVIFAGLPDSFESEGYDRTHMRLPQCQNMLIESISNVQPNTVVVLHNGSPVEMPWIKKVKSVLELYLSGQGAGQAAVDLLYGKVNPSGKLAETFPLRLEDTPSFLNFPGAGEKVEYKEGVFVGYRYYDSKKMPVLFPFGHGISYTAFAYSNCRQDKRVLHPDETVSINLDITNTGSLPGKEVVQLYIKKPGEFCVQPEKELKGFEKIELLPGKTENIKFLLDRDSFLWFDSERMTWRCSGGKYEIWIGSSSRDIRLKTEVMVVGDMIPLKVDENTRMEELFAHPKTAAVAEKLMNRYYPDVTKNNVEKEAINAEMERRSQMESPLRLLRSFKGVSQQELEIIIKTLNKHIRF